MRGHPTHEHLFQPGHAETARRIADRGWPAGYLAVCVLCGAPVDLVVLLRPPDGAPAARSPGDDRPQGPSSAP